MLFPIPRFASLEAVPGGPATLLGSLLPSCVAVAEQRGSFAGDLLPEEQQSLGRAVPKRQIEFAAGRRCARQALGKLGIPPYPILRGSRREPLWPDGVAGSITHCDGYCAAAASFADQVAGLGIDAEPDEPLPAGVLPRIARAEEIESLHRLPNAARCNADRLLFSAKESTYKAWYPLTRSWLDFDAVRIEFAFEEAAFTIAFVGAAPLPPACLQFSGRYLVREGLILTSVLATGGAEE